MHEREAAWQAKLDAATAACAEEVRANEAAALERLESRIAAATSVVQLKLDESLQQRASDRLAHNAEVAKMSAVRLAAVAHLP